MFARKLRVLKHERHTSCDASALKFLTVLGTVLPNSAMIILPFASPPMLMSRYALSVTRVSESALTNGPWTNQERISTATTLMIRCFSKTAKVQLPLEVLCQVVINWHVRFLLLQTPFVKNLCNISHEGSSHKPERPEKASLKTVFCRKHRPKKAKAKEKISIKAFPGK